MCGMVGSFNRLRLRWAFMPMKLLYFLDLFLVFLRPMKLLYFLDLFLVF